MTDSMPFDTLATGYDAAFSHTAIGRYLRGRVQARLEQRFGAGSQALELGCGTGEDALWLANRGVSVLATDASPAMLDAARAKAAGHPGVRFAPLDLRALPPALPGETFAGAFANFGPLNCLDEWRTLAGWLAGCIGPGGFAAFAVMSPVCLWEPVWHAAHGDFRTATRRWRQTATFAPGGAAPMPVRYPTVSRLTREFAPAFRRVHVEPLGLFLPPSDVYGAVEKRPRLLAALMRLERRFGRAPALALLADHYWIEFERAQP